MESSFNPAAYSKVGAAGLWQFMRSTGRRYMRIDSAVDDRLDPFRSTEAAAQLLAYNYRLLGTWPLALTAYNHGSAGMLRAKETMGTDDIVTIVRGYTSRSFGFASRNFYVSFLAALEIDHNPEKYFGPLQKEPEAHFREVEVPAYVSMAALTRTVKVDGEKLRTLNPGLLPPVWEGQQRVPKAYRLRLPLEGDPWTTERLAQRLSPGDMFNGQRGPDHYKVQKGDTLVSIAATYEVPVEVLARINHLRTSARVSPGRILVLPESTAPVVAVEPPAPAPAAAAGAAQAGTVAPPLPGGAVPAAVAQRESAEDAAAAEASGRALYRLDRGSLGCTGGSNRALARAGLRHRCTSRTPTRPTTRWRKDDTIRVATEETLGHLSDWLGVNPARGARSQPHGCARKPAVGQRVKLDFRNATHEVFEARRREYHRSMQASYFASHRIVGTQVYIARAGDSLWTLTQRTGQVPQWLLQQYNPNLDFSNLRPGPRSWSRACRRSQVRGLNCTAALRPRVSCIAARPAGSRL